MTVLLMEERHLPALVRIEQQCFRAPWNESMLREELGKGIFLVAEQNGEAVGYVGCQTVLDEGYITNVAVSPGARRQGVGRALISALAKRATEIGMTFITLEVRVSNEAAIALYTEAGFERAGLRKNFYSAPSEDAVLMTLFLKRSES